MLADVMTRPTAEAALGITKAIKDKAVTEVKGYEGLFPGKTPDGDIVAFIVGRAFTGTFTSRVGEVTGAYVEITGSLASKKTYSQLRMIQVVQSAKKEGDKLVPVNPLMLTRQIRAGYKRLFGLRTVAYRDPKAESAGWGIDVTPTTLSPWISDKTNYARIGNKSSDFWDTPGHFPPGTEGVVHPALGASTMGLMGSPLGQGPLLAASALTPGRIKGGDNISAKDTGRLFITALIGWNGEKSTPVYLGSIRWGYYIDDKGKASFVNGDGTFSDNPKPMVDKTPPAELGYALGRNNRFVKWLDPKTPEDNIDIIPKITHIKVE
jgi:hypothetical protein